MIEEREDLQEPPGAPAGEPAEGPPEESSPRLERLIRLSPRELRQGVEALLFASAQPVSIRELAETFECTVHEAREAVEELRLEYVNQERAFRLEEVAGGVQLLTLPRYEPWIRRHLSQAREGRLSAAAFETLAVIAYKQPINKADLEAIRGVQCGPILKTLLEKNLVKVVGREDTLGKPLLYGTTARFLESFGLSSLNGLPQPDLEGASAAAAAPARTPGPLPETGEEDPSAAAAPLDEAPRGPAGTNGNGADGDGGAAGAPGTAEEDEESPLEGAPDPT